MVTRQELKRIRRIMLDFGAEDDLNGWCAFSSYVVNRAIASRGGSPVLHYNRFHCFSEYSGHFLDITASQFDARLSPIYLSKSPLLNDNGYGIPIHLSEQSFRFKPGEIWLANQKLAVALREWPASQNPFETPDLLKSVCSRIRKELGIDIRGQFC